MDKAQRLAAGARSCDAVEQAARGGSAPTGRWTPARSGSRPSPRRRCAPLLASLTPGKASQPILAPGVMVMMVCTKEQRNLAEFTPGRRSSNCCAAGTGVELLSRQLQRDLRRRARRSRCGTDRHFTPEGLPSLKDTIARHGLEARKSLGQHFLLDEGSTAASSTLAGDLTGRHVLEVGPGPGRPDPRPAGRPGRDGCRGGARPPRGGGAGASWKRPSRPAHGDQADALGIDVAALLPAPRVILANLPYNVATPLLVKLAAPCAGISGMALMFQQEVAERICAAPDTGAYGRLAVLAQWRCRCELLLRAAPAPSPRRPIWSAVVGFTPHPEDPGDTLFRAEVDG